MGVWDCRFNLKFVVVHVRWGIKVGSIYDKNKLLIYWYFNVNTKLLQNTGKEVTGLWYISWLVIHDRRTLLASASVSELFLSMF